MIDTRKLTLGEQTQIFDLATGSELPSKLPPAIQASSSADGKSVLLLQEKQCSLILLFPLYPIKPRHGCSSPAVLGRRSLGP